MNTTNTIALGRTIQTILNAGAVELEPTYSISGRVLARYFATEHFVFSVHVRASGSAMVEVWEGHEVVGILDEERDLDHVEYFLFHAYP